MNHCTREMAKKNVKGDYEVRFVLDQHVYLDFYRASSL